MSDKKALVFDIQRYSLHDGPGIRTMIFLKGCPLRCIWCANPESQEKHIEIEFYETLCRGCGICKTVCEQGAIDMIYGRSNVNKDLCINCGKCADVCNFSALRTVGRWTNVTEAVNEVKKDMKYFRRSGGGITLSGGEPLIWTGFCEDVLRKCYDLNINTAVETAGYVNRESFERVKDYVDVFLYDIKSINRERHRKLTGVFNDLILENIKWLRGCGKEVIIRIPLIPGCNFYEEEIDGIFDLAKNLKISRIEIMPYHNLGEIKYKRLFREYTLKGTESLKFSANMEYKLSKLSHIFQKNKDISISIG